MQLSWQHLLLFISQLSCSPVLWIRGTVPLDPAKDGLEVLLSPEPQSILAKLGYGAP